MLATHKAPFSNTVQLTPFTFLNSPVALTDYIAMSVDKLVTTLQHLSTSPHPGIKVSDHVIQGVR